MSTKTIQTADLDGFILDYAVMLCKEKPEYYELPEGIIKHYAETKHVNEAERIQLETSERGFMTVADARKLAAYKMLVLLLIGHTVDIPEKFLK